MARGHERFEELAVGHVLGGLDPVDAAEFRSHLVSCRVCRAHVSELRELASDLAAAEREERTSAKLKTEVVRRPAPSEAEEEPPGWRRRSSLLALGLIVVGAIGVGLGLWNYHLRGANDTLLDAASSREATLESIGRGDLVATEFAAGTRGVVVTDGAWFATTLVDLPNLAPGDVLVVWLVGPDGAARAIHYDVEAPDGGRLALRDDHRGAETMLVTVQPSPVTEPGGVELVRASLRADEDAQSRVSRSSSK